jgi:hypothetical protein
VNGEGSSTTLSQITVDSNAGDNPFGVLRVVNGGSAELRESTIENNGLLEVGRITWKSMQQRTEY